MQQDPYQAVVLYRGACSAGVAEACTNLGFHYDAGDGVEQSDARANEFSLLGCTLGDMYGCNNVGWAYEQGTGVTRNLETAARFYRQACDGGNQLGCNNLSNLISPN